ncbi:hypothetical protein TNCV_1503551 [Trichonephila clavipes]|uniref:Uncharacterized protein n=1 Tax=Trichonephila clavipes TaxID=2585209 RepID=A0A8X6RTZ8_TRICX|nr:hypothetical protein TNCV_1503551 [Trichonephila clavipes]
MTCLGCTGHNTIRAIRLADSPASIPPIIHSPPIQLSSRTACLPQLFFCKRFDGAPDLWTSTTSSIVVNSHPSIVRAFLRSTSCKMTCARGHGAIVYCLNSGSDDSLTGRHNEFPAVRSAGYKCVSPVPACGINEDLFA